MKTYWKDIRQSFTSSMGRFLSIFSLMMIGAMALIALKVTAPNLEKTAQEFIDQQNMLDFAVMSDLGLSEDDEEELSNIADSQVEFGYFTDVSIENTNDAVRVFSKTEDISQFELVAGEMPSSSNEIALDNNMRSEYAIGDTIHFTQKGSEDEQLLDKESFTVTGFVNSSEIWDRQAMGNAGAGFGQLTGYAVVSEESFDSEYYTIARLKFADLDGLTYTSDAYKEKEEDIKSDLEDLIADNGEKRLASIQADGQEEIDKAQDKIDESKQELADASQAIADGQAQAADGQAQIDKARASLSQEQAQLDQGFAQLQGAQSEIFSSQSALSSFGQALDQAAHRLANSQSQLALWRQGIDQGQASLAAKEAEFTDLETTKNHLEQEIANKESQLEDLKSQPSQVASPVTSPANGQWSVSLLETDNKQAGSQDITSDDSDATNHDQEVSDDESGLGDKSEDEDSDPEEQEDKQDTGQSQPSDSDQSSNQDQAGDKQSASQITRLEAEIAGLKDRLSQLENQASQGQSQLQAAQDRLDQEEADYQNALLAYQEGRQEYQSQLASYQAAQEQLSAGQAELDQHASQLQAGQTALDSAWAQIAQNQAEIDQALAELAQASDDFAEKRVDAEAKIAEAEADLDQAQSELADLTAPEYTVYTRTTLPGSDGYMTYDNAVSSIDAVANIFPIVLYLVAAMVTFTTMTRFVDEERQNAGLLKALGYTNRQIIAKFMIYGFVASMIGTVIGILLGNYLVSPIIGKTISATTVIGDSNLYFYPAYILLAIALALVSAVLPAWYVARKELTEEPAFLLQAKPPVAGEKILLERISFIWKRLRFNQKVTARNIFRYKQRMLMTVFGVAGSVALLFGGLGIRSSISGVIDSQFEDVIQYDMVVAQADDLESQEEGALSQALDRDEVKAHLDVAYFPADQEIPGVTENQQLVTYITDQPDQLHQFVRLRDRKSQEPIKLSDDGIVISEKIADLYGVEVGDSIPITLDDQDYQAKVTGITEMYAGHFAFMTANYYQELTGNDFAVNAHLVNLKNRDWKQVENVAADYMAMDAVAAVIQNTGMVQLLDSLSSSLESVMVILIILSVLLGVVILYNLTNINVAERMRELSTIKVLGFHNKEVTLYIYRETIILSFVGIIVGLLAGNLFHQVLLQVVGADNIMFNPTATPEVYLIPIVAIVGIVAVLGVIVNRRLRRVDMLEALQSSE